MKKFIVVFVLALLITGLIAKPSAAQATDATVTMAFVEGEPGSLDPQVAETINEFLVLRNVYEGLVSYDPKTLQPTPGLATSWDVSTDGLVYTFHLRPNVKFHNGRLVTAQDVKYSLERLANPKTGKSYTTFLLDGVQGIDALRKGTATEVDGLKVVDEHTFQITLSHPTASFLNQLTLPGGFVVPKEAAELTTFGENPVGTGPFKFVQWSRRKQVTLEANTDYWGGAPQIQYVVLKVTPNSVQQVEDFKSGKVDVTIVPAFNVQALQDDPKLGPQLEQIPPLQVTYLILNLKDSALSNPDVRRALNVAINRDELLKGVLKGQGLLAQGVIPPLLSAYDKDLPFAYNPAEAKELLAKAGFADGLQLDVTLATDETDKRVMGVIQTQLAEVGVQLTINSTDKNSYDTTRKVCKGKMFLSTWTGDYADPDDFTTLLLDSSAMRKSCGYGEYPGVDAVKALLDQAEAMKPGPDRDDVYRKAQRMAEAQAINIPIVFHSQSALISSRLTGAYLDATLGINFATITIKN